MLRCDVRLLARVLVRLHDEALDHRRVDRADHDRDEAPQADRDDREHPAAAEDVEDEQDRGRDRDEHQQVERRQLRLHVGVGGAVDHAPVREREAEPREVVLHGLGERHQREDHRDVHLHLRRDPLERRLQADAAVEVVEHRGDDQDHEQRRERPSRDELEERQLEHVEADVAVELRVLDPELRRMREEDPVAPLGRDAARHHDREEGRDREADATRRTARRRCGTARRSRLRGPRVRASGANRSATIRSTNSNDEEDHREDQRGEGLRLDQPAPRLARSATSWNQR